jgi:hypothetical protein
LRDREKRCQTASELARALLPFGSQRARLSYDSILGVCAKAEQETGSSTLTGMEPAVPNEYAAREEWKSLGTADFASAVDRFEPGPGWPPSRAADAPDEAPTGRVTSAPEAAVVRDDIAPGEEFTRREARRARPAPSAPLSEQSDDGVRRPLISFVRGKLPSVSDMGTTSTELKWIHRPQIRNGRVIRNRSVRGGHHRKQRLDIVLWGVCALAVIAAIALLADHYRRVEPTVTARPSPSAAATMLPSEPHTRPVGQSVPVVVTTDRAPANIQPVPLTESGARPVQVKWANFALPVRP